MMCIPTVTVSETADEQWTGARALRRTGRWFWSVRRLMLVCGAWLIPAFPVLNLEWLAWSGLVLIVRAPTARDGGMRAWWLGTDYLIAALYWMAPEIEPAVLLVGAVMDVLWVLWVLLDRG